METIGLLFWYGLFCGLIAALAMTPLAIGAFAYYFSRREAERRARQWAGRLAQRERRPRGR